MSLACFRESRKLVRTDERLVKLNTGRKLVKGWKSLDTLVGDKLPDGNGSGDA